MYFVDDEVFGQGLAFMYKFGTAMPRATTS